MTASGTRPGTPTRYRNAALAQERFGDLAEHYRASLSRTDLLGDAAAAALAALGPQRHAALEDALQAGRPVPGTPDALAALLEDLARVPVDHDLLDAGARALGRCEAAYVVAAKQALYWSFASGAAVKPLAWTAELREPAAAARRLAETGTYTVDAIRPGRLRPGASAWRSSVRVRLVHARLRTRLLESGRWDTAAWGAPINLADQSKTLLEFCHLPLRMLGQLGYRFDAAQTPAVHALWQHVGHLVGVPDELNPGTPEGSTRLFDLVELTRDPPDDDSRELVASVLTSGRTGLRTRGERLGASVGEAVERAMAWHHLTAAQLAAVGFPPTRASRVVPVVRAGVRVTEAICRAAPSFERRLSGAVRAFDDDMIALAVERASRTSGGAARPSPVAGPVGAPRPGPVPGPDADAVAVPVAGAAST